MTNRVEAWEKDPDFIAGRLQGTGLLFEERAGIRVAKRFIPAWYDNYVHMGVWVLYAVKKGFVTINLIKKNDFPFPYYFFSAGSSS